MFNFRLFAVCVIVMLVLAVGVLVWESATIQTTSASPTRSPAGRRLLELERMNDADNLTQGSQFAPRPGLPQQEPIYSESNSGALRRW